MNTRATAVDHLPPAIDPVPAATAPAPEVTTSRRGSAFWWVLAVLGVGSVAVVNWLVSRHSSIGPRTPWDEIGVIAAARFLSGDTGMPLTVSLGYYPGAGVLMAPVYWFTSDAETVYAAMIWINMAIGLATIWPLAVVARKLGVSVPQAIVVGSIVMLTPSRTALSDYVLSEQTLAFCVAWATAAAFMLWEKPTWWRLAFLVSMLSATYVTHARGLVVVLVALVWLLFFVRRRVSIALVGIVATLIGTWLAQTFAIWVVSHVIMGEFGQGSSLLDQLLGLNGMFARVAFTHTWAQLVATGGVIALGLVASTRSVWTDLFRDRVLGPTGFIWGTAVAGAMLSFVSWSTWDLHFYPDGPRLDSWIYTRYIDPFVMGLLVVALVTIIKVAPRLSLLAAAAVSGIIIAGTLVWAVRIIPTWGSNYGPGNDAGLSALLPLAPKQPIPLPMFPTFTNDNRFWAIGSLVAVIGLLIMFALRRWPALLVTVLGAAAVWASVVGNPNQDREIPWNLEAAVTLTEKASGSTLDLPIAARCTPSGTDRTKVINWVGYWLAPRNSAMFDPARDASAVAVIACVDWADAAQYGARRVEGLSNFGFALWILDPRVADEVAADGITLSAVGGARPFEE